VRERFDRRVMPDSAIEFVRACQGRVDCHLGGGAALAGAYLGHRLSNDIDLFVHDRAAHRILVSVLGDVAAEVSGRVELRLDAGTYVRAELTLPDHALELDVVFEAVPDIESPPQKLEGLSIESLADLRASKLTCLLSRSEPRDLVDVLFLERSGYRPEEDFELALRKDAGMDPGILAWLLNDFPTEPMPIMLLPLERDELLAYRDELRDRFKRMATSPA